MPEASPNKEADRVANGRDLQAHRNGLGRHTEAAALRVDHASVLAKHRNAHQLVAKDAGGIQRDKIPCKGADGQAVEVTVLRTLHLQGEHAAYVHRKRSAEGVGRLRYGKALFTNSHVKADLLGQSGKKLSRKLGKLQYPARAAEGLQGDDLTLCKDLLRKAKLFAARLRQIREGVRVKHDGHAPCREGQRLALLKGVAHRLVQADRRMLGVQSDAGVGMGDRNGGAVIGIGQLDLAVERLVGNVTRHLGRARIPAHEHVAAFVGRARGVLGRHGGLAVAVERGLGAVAQIPGHGIANGGLLIACGVDGVLRDGKKLLVPAQKLVEHGRRVLALGRDGTGRGLTVEMMRHVAVLPELPGHGVVLGDRVEIGVEGGVLPNAEEVGVGAVGTAPAAELVGGLRRLGNGEGGTLVDHLVAVLHLRAVEQLIVHAVEADRHAVVNGDEILLRLAKGERPRKLLRASRSQSACANLLGKRAEGVTHFGSGRRGRRHHGTPPGGLLLAVLDRFFHTGRLRRLFHTGRLRRLFDVGKGGSLGGGHELDRLGASRREGLGRARIGVVRVRHVLHVLKNGLQRAVLVQLPCGVLRQRIVQAGAQHVELGHQILQVGKMPPIGRIGMKLERGEEAAVLAHQLKGGLQGGNVVAQGEVMLGVEGVERAVALHLGGVGGRTQLIVGGKERTQGGGGVCGLLHGLVQIENGKLVLTGQHLRDGVAHDRAVDLPVVAVRNEKIVQNGQLLLDGLKRIQEGAVLQIAIVGGLARGVLLGIEGIGRVIVAPCLPTGELLGVGRVLGAVGVVFCLGAIVLRLGHRVGRVVLDLLEVSRVGLGVLHLALMKRKRTLVDEQTVKRRASLGVGRVRKLLQLPLRKRGPPGEVHVDEEVGRVEEILEGANVGVANAREGLALRGSAARLGLNGRPLRDPGDRRTVDGGVGIREDGDLEDPCLAVIVIGKSLAGDQAAVTEGIARVSVKERTLDRRGRNAAKLLQKLRARQGGIFVQSGIAEMQRVGGKLLVGKSRRDRAKREEKAE